MSELLTSQRQYVAAIVDHVVVDVPAADRQQVAADIGVVDQRPTSVSPLLRTFKPAGAGRRILKAGSRWASCLVLVATASFMAPSVRAADDEAFKILRGMSDYLASQKTISLSYDSDIEVITPDIEKIQFASSGKVLLSRPDKLTATRTLAEPFNSNLKKAHVQVIDLSAMKSDDPMNHAKFAQGDVVAAIGKRRAASHEQQAAAAAIHEIADQLLLRGCEIVRLHAADDQPLELEQILGLGREALFQILLFRTGRELPVQLVLRGAHHRPQLDIRVVVERSPGFDS